MRVGVGRAGRAGNAAACAACGEARARARAAVRVAAAVLRATRAAPPFLFSLDFFRNYCC